MTYLFPLLLASLVSLQPITSIKIEGTHLFSEEEIIRKLQLTHPVISEQNDIEKRVRSILAFYKSEGYLDVSLTYEIHKNILVLSITEGELYRIGTIKIKGNRFIKNTIFLELLLLHRSRTFTLRNFEHSVSDVLDFYGNSGFPFARIVPVYFTLSEKTIDIELEIEEGPRLRWGNVLVRGNTITRDYIIQKQMRIPKRKYFSERQLHVSRVWLEKLPFIAITDTFNLKRGTESGTLDILVSITEVKSNRMSGIIGYIPPIEEKTGGYIGIITAEMLNLFGTGRALRVKWAKQLPPYTKLDVTYTEPWIFGSMATMEFSLFHLIEDTMYTFSKAQLKVTTDISHNLSLSILTGWEKFSPAAIDIPPAKKYSFGTELRIATLDYAPNPRKGIDYRFYTEYGKKTSIDIMKFSLHLLNVTPFFANNVLAFLVSGKASRTNEPPLPEYEQFTLGGYNSLRGYRQRQFRTIQLLRISPEYRFIVSKKSRLYFFYDAAYFKTASYPHNATANYYKDGYGVGAKFATKLGILSIEYALGEERAPMKGKIHLGIDTTF